MTNVNDINVGDRVKATNKESGETVEGVVARVRGVGVETKEFWLNGLRWNFEVLERAHVELPTKQHALVASKHLHTPYLRMNGKWWDVRFLNPPVQVGEHVVKQAIRRDGFRVVFEGVDD